jgi:hypothetical protein
MRTRLFFKSFYIVRHWGIHNAPSPLLITVDDVSMSFSPLAEDNLKPFYEKDDWHVQLTTSKEVSERTRQKFDADDYATNPRVMQVTAEELIRAHATLIRFLRVVRWRVGFVGHSQLVRCKLDATSLSTNGQVWRPAPCALSVSVADELYAHPYSLGLFKELDSLLRAEQSEPVAHELWREAWNLRSRSPRASLMLGLSALEVGVKAYVAASVPNAQWLCEEVPSPPVEKMLREYLPRLPSLQSEATGPLRIADSVLEKLKQAIKRRNEVTHRGDAIAQKEVQDWLKLVRGVLYTLDVHRGHSWAERHVG